MTSKLANVGTLAVRCPNWVGDIVMATPVFECLRQSLPQTRIVGVIKRSARGIVTDSPWFDALVDGNDKTWPGFLRMREQIRAEAPDAAILLTNSLRSALTMRLSGVPRVYGYRRQGRGLLLTGGPTASHNGTITPIPMGRYYLEICRWLGLDAPRSPGPPCSSVQSCAARRGAAGAVRRRGKGFCCRTDPRREFRVFQMLAR